MKLPLHTQLRVLAPAVATALVVSSAACTSDDSDSDGGDSSTTLSIATVDNPDLERLRELGDAFTEEHPEVTLDWVVQDENQIRQTISTDVGTQAGRFDVVTVGAYESEVWADEDYLTPLTDMSDGFNADDFIPTVRDALTHDDELQAAPFYGESMTTMYRKDILADAGIDMPDEPTWDDILAAAEQLDSADTDASGTDGAEGTAPICIRGKAGWGENVALLSAMAHAYGARWFDEDWTPQLNSTEWTKTFDDYVELGKYAPDNIADMGYQENLEAFAAGDCAIWTDTTVAASYLTDPETSAVADDVGFAAAPRHESGEGTGNGSGNDAGRDTNWLWTWALAIPDSSEQKDLAKEFITWATSHDYTELVADNYGWANVPPGAREDIYEQPEYLDAAPFAPLVQKSVESADITEPAATDVPYVGIQYVGVPEFQSIGTSVGQQLTDAMTGTTSLDEAQKNSQWVTNQITERSQMTDESNEKD